MMPYGGGVYVSKLLALAAAPEATLSPPVSMCIPIAISRFPVHASINCSPTSCVAPESININK